MSDKRQQGLDILERLIGSEDFARRQASENAFNGDFRRLTDEYAFASVWSREGLDWKSRSFLCIAALAAQGLWGQLRFHANSALNNGATVTELREAAIHLTIYIGFPKAAEALAVMEQVIARREAEPAS